MWQQPEELHSENSRSSVLNLSETEHLLIFYRYYDDGLQQQRYIHFISKPALDLRLLEHFYTFLHFQDP
jgi:hypothetical protein